MTLDQTTVACPQCNGQDSADCMGCLGSGKVTLTEWISNLITPAFRPVATHVVAEQHRMVDGEAKAGNGKTWAEFAQGAGVDEATFTDGKVRGLLETMVGEFTSMTLPTQLGIVSILNPAAYECLQLQLDPTYVPEPKTETATATPVKTRKAKTAKAPEIKQHNDDIPY